MSSSELFKCVTWNFDIKASYSKFQAMIKNVKENNPDVIFLQEITDISLKHLKEELGASEYEVITSEKYFHYFTVTAINKKTVKLKSKKVLYFHKSKMGRNLLITEVEWNGHIIHLINSQLESTYASSLERKRQALSLFRIMRDLEETAPVIFAGDTNLRDSEVAQLGGLPQGIEDAWEFLGKPKNTEFTWSNERFDVREYEPKLESRFDRVFFSRNSHSSVVPQNMIPLGANKLPSGHYPSDHIGLFVSFLISKIPLKFQ